MGSDNTDQRDFWTDLGGRDWLTFEAGLDAAFARLDDILIREAQPEGAMRVMDLGCGTGRTSRRIANRLEAGGSVLGVDISPTLLAEARRVGGAGLRYLEADAQTHPFDAGAFDLILSRFGSMFFADPVAGLGNLRRALKPGGKMVLICWRRAKENPWFSVPLKAGLTHFGPLGQVDPTAPGPTAFADEARVLDLLDQAGFAHSRAEVIETTLPYPGPLEDLLTVLARLGPLAGLAEAHNPDAEARAAALNMVADAFRAPDGLGSRPIPARLNLFVAQA